MVVAVGMGFAEELTVRGLLLVDKRGYLAEGWVRLIVSAGFGAMQGIVAMVIAPMMVGIATRIAGVPSTTAPVISNAIDTTHTKTMAKLNWRRLRRVGRWR